MASIDMLLVLPVPFRRMEGKLHLEAQAANGAARWADNFARVAIAAPVIPEGIALRDAPATWTAADAVEGPRRFEFVPLPWAYHPADFARAYGPTRRLLGRLIARSRYLQFAIGGLLGDWGLIGVLEARRQGRRHAIHSDRVEHEVMRAEARRGGWKDRLRALVCAPIMERLHMRLLRGCDLALMHGADCFTAFRDSCPNTHLIHNVHTKPDDGIPEADLLEKARRAGNTAPLQVVYAGRAAPMKAPLDWLRAVGRARERGADLRAAWLGDGQLGAAMHALRAELGLEDVVELPGYVGDRAAVLARLRAADVMLFTHITPESPRCLIEALVCGTPLVGYQSGFSDDLVSRHGGGVFVPVGDWRALGDRLAELAGARTRLADLILRAAYDGRRFNDEAVFRERSELIKHHLNGPPRSRPVRTLAIAVTPNPAAMPG